MTEIWVTRHPADGILRVYSTRDEATADSLRINRADHYHPAFCLWRIDLADLKAEFVGRLTRRFGYDFDPNPWEESA